MNHMYNVQYPKQIGLYYMDIMGNNTTINCMWTKTIYNFRSLSKAKYNFTWIYLNPLVDISAINELKKVSRGMGKNFFHSLRTTNHNFTFWYQAKNEIMVQGHICWLKIIQWGLHTLSHRTYVFA